MSLVFAAITPHPPLLIPAIGEKVLKKISKTKAALEKLEEELYLAKPDCIIIITPHGQVFSDAFSLNVCTTFTSNFKEFGDLFTHLTFEGEVSLPGAIRSAAKSVGLQTVLISSNSIDHGVSVPLYYLTKHLPKVKIMPVGYADLDAKNHLEFGYLIKDHIMKSTKRFAVIASGDLSHALTTDAPAGFHPTGVEFDKKIQELLLEHNTAGMLQLDSDFVDQAAECGFRAFLILMGVLRGVHYRYESLSYEGPFGVGYLTANFIL